MKLLPLATTVVCVGCKAIGQQQPIEGEVRNASASCKPTEYASLNQQTLACTVQGDVVLTGAAAKEHPWSAYLQRIVNGNQQPPNALPWVLIVDGAGKFSDYYAEDRPLKDDRPPPRLEYKIVAVQPLLTVTSH